MKEYDLYTPDGEMLGGFTDLSDLEDRAEELKLEDYRIVVSVHPDPPLRVFFYSYAAVVVVVAHDRDEAKRMMFGLGFEHADVEEVDLSKPYALRLT